MIVPQEPWFSGGWNQIFWTCGLTRTGSLSLFASPWPFSLSGTSHTWYSRCCKWCCHVWVRSRHGSYMQKNPEEIAEILSDFLEDCPEYGILSNNCCHWADKFARRLGVRGLPRWVNQAATMAVAVSGLLRWAPHLSGPPPLWFNAIDLRSSWQSHDNGLADHWPWGCLIWKGDGIKFGETIKSDLEYHF